MQARDVWSSSPRYLLESDSRKNIGNQYKGNENTSNKVHQYFMSRRFPHHVQGQVFKHEDMVSGIPTKKDPYMIEEEYKEEETKK